LRAWFLLLSILGRIKHEGFALGVLPELAEEKTTKEQLSLCLEAAASDRWETVFD